MHHKLKHSNSDQIHTSVTLYASVFIECVAVVVVFSFTRAISNEKNHNDDDYQQRKEDKTEKFN